jgi:hypothetical protein
MPVLGVCLLIWFASRPEQPFHPPWDGVACQRDGTTSLPRAWDHLEVLLSIVGLCFGVKAGVPVGVGSLPVGGAFDDEGVCAGGEPVDGGLGE